MSTPPPGTYTDPTLPLSDRVEDLLTRLTTAEKVAMLHQHQAAVPRLGLGAFRTGTEALHGLAWLGEATVFPQAVGLGATWDPELIRAVGEAIGDEVRARHHADPDRCGLNVWAPVVNPLRDPRWGRNEEGYAEDAWLTGVLSTAYASGLRGSDRRYLKTAPTIKHFCAYNNETDRTRTSSDLSPRVLHEYELPAHRPAIASGAAVAVMAAYNLVNGRPAHVTPLINDELRTWTNEHVVVVSDAQAPSNLVDDQGFFTDHADSHAAALRAGIDSFTDNDADSATTTARVTDALDRGLLTKADIDTAVRRLLHLRFRLGEFDPPALNPYATTSPDVINCADHQRLARRAASRGVVLLRNTGILPLVKRTVAVVGPLADTTHTDWYSGTLPYAVTVFGGLLERFGADAVTHCEGVDRVAVTVGSGGLTAETTGTVAVTTDNARPEWDVLDWGGGVTLFRSPGTGRYLRVDDTGRLVADSPGPHSWEVHETFRLVQRTDGEVTIRHVATGRYLVADNEGVVTAGADDPNDATAFAIDLVASGADAAAAAAASADVAVVVLGNHPLVNGRETEDRDDLELPAAQQSLLKAVHAANPATVLILTSSYPYAAGWADENLPAVVWSSHGGQEYGRALADVLLGDTDPAGRLPQTWYGSAIDLPDLLDYDIIASDATYQYYRGAPLYPFGHGLSYTTFEYENLRLSRSRIGPDDRVIVQVDVVNAGDRPGEEVVQLYTHQMRSRVKQPLRSLRGFVRVALAPHERRTVEIGLSARDLAFWDVTSGAMVVEQATHRVMAGRSATDIRQTALLTVDGTVIGPRGPYALRTTDCDASSATERRPSSPLSGEAMAAVEPGAWLAFHRVRLGPDLTSARIRAARSAPGEGVLRLRTEDPLIGREIARLAVPATGDAYTFTEITTALAALPQEVTDLFLTFDDTSTIVADLDLTE